MPYRYRCARCGTTSRLYSTRPAADAHGEEHRHKEHSGDYPDGEQIQHVPGHRPSRAEVIATVIAMALLITALVSRI
ncbi:hypothetical protein [Streptomyces mobaraensis]|uniref:Uncharacterized protein n=1 Tax=Streptomyces mobaraensis TaxID=35621 RepID=A0A5N5WCS0_STRMB|nr:hypothetical protein [Streptomyces mobaraensis]KAB7850146.1 hypothetical protein FRZ00_05980 [Streptomyces mobaraensis]